MIVDYVQDKQSETMWIPGGYLVFIPMTWCLGVQVFDFHHRPLAERVAILQAFKAAYEYPFLPS